MTKPLVPPHIQDLKPYPPGKPIEELKRELGLNRVIKLASNESPFGPSPKAREAVMACAAGLHRYPDGSGYYLKQKLSQKHGHPPERIVLGCGTNEIIDHLGRVFVGPGGGAVVPHPSFLVYQKFLQAVGAEATLVGLNELDLDLEAMAGAVDEKTRLMVICNPNNPTGTFIDLPRIEALVKELPETVTLLVDEAYLDFVRGKEAATAMDLVGEERSICVTRTFSKAYGLAGLRIGYGVMSASMADFVNRVRQPFNVTSPALAGAEAALDDQEFLDSVLEKTWDGLDLLTRELSRLGLKTYPSQTNFLLFEVPGKAAQVYQKMLTKGVIIRHMGSFGLEDFLRVSVGTEEENTMFLDRLALTLGEL